MFPFVRVEWVDAMQDNSWKTVSDLKKSELADAQPCITVGFLVRKNRQFLYVAGTLSPGLTVEEALINGIMMIPRKWIKRMDEINLEELIEQSNCS